MATFSALDTPVINQQITKDILETIKDNFDFFRTPPKGFYSPSVAASNITTTSTTFTTITGFSVDVTSQGGLLAVMLALRISGSGSTETIRLDLTLDGISVTGDDTGFGIVSARVVDIQIPVTVWRILAPAAGAHTIAARWRVSSGTGTIYPAGLCQLAVWELYLP